MKKKRRRKDSTIKKVHLKRKKKKLTLPIPQWRTVCPIVPLVSVLGRLVQHWIDNLVPTMNLE
tara:strand:- start:89 stop:277 length:189 start_codon:yes stop_codon:yes gene_type:complete